MGRPLPLTYKPPLTDEEREAKLKLKGQVGTAGLVVTTFLMLNILETFLNAQFNLFPQFKREWNYSVNSLRPRFLPLIRPAVTLIWCPECFMDLLFNLRFTSRTRETTMPSAGNLRPKANTPRYATLGIWII